MRKSTRKYHPEASIRLRHSEPRRGEESRSEILRRPLSRTPQDDERLRHLAMTGYSLLFLTLAPFLCGFKFLSGWKNEQGNRYYEKGQVGKARAAYENALKKDPTSPEIAFNLGNAYYRETSYDKSLEAYRQAARKPRSSGLKSKAFYNLGNTRVRQNRTEDAAEFYKEALRLNPRDEDAKYNLEFLKKKSEEKKQQEKQQQKQKEQNQKQDQGQGSQSEKNQSPQEAQGQESKEQKGEGEGQNKKEERGRENKEQPQGEEERKGQEEREGQEPKKTQGQIRADQILDAIENQEKQVLKLGGPKNPARRVRRVTEYDW